jgi:hypothetical protein
MKIGKLKLSISRHFEMPIMQANSLPREKEDG